MKLIDGLRECGAKLPTTEAPTVSEVGNIIAGLVYYLEHGSLEVAEPETPEQAPQPSVEEGEVERLKQELAEARDQAIADVGPSPVAPPPPDQGEDAGAGVEAPPQIDPAGPPGPAAPGA